AHRLLGDGGAPPAAVAIIDAEAVIERDQVGDRALAPHAAILRAELADRRLFGKLLLRRRRRGGLERRLERFHDLLRRVAMQAEDRLDLEGAELHDLATPPPDPAPPTPLPPPP